MLKTCQRGLHQYEGRRCQECARVTAAAYSKAHLEQGRARAAKWREAHPGHDAASAARYRANHPERVKASKAKYRQSEHGRAREAAYRKTDAHQKSDAAYRKTDACRKSHDVWQKKNPEKRCEAAGRRRARKRNATTEPVTKQHLALLLEAQDGACRYCRNPLDGEKHLEHRVPLARGGAHAPHNVCWSCPSCNLRKGTMTEAEFLAGRAA